MRVLFVKLHVRFAECVDSARKARINNDRVRDWFRERMQSHALIAKSYGMSVGRSTDGSIAVQHVPLRPP